MRARMHAYILLCTCALNAQSRVCTAYALQVSKVRIRLCPRGRANNIMDRERGSFVKDGEELREPMRTERLLSRPFGIFHDNRLDSIDPYLLSSYLPTYLPTLLADWLPG